MIPEKTTIQFRGAIQQYMNIPDFTEYNKLYSPMLSFKRKNVHSLDIVHVLCDCIEDQHAFAMPIVRTLRVNDGQNLKPQYKKVIMQGEELESINIRIIDKFSDEDWSLHLGDVTLVLHVQSLSQF